MVHEAAGAMLPVHVFVWLNGPVTATLVTWRGPVPLLCTVTVRAALEVPNNCEENDKVVGVTVAAGVVPVPVNGTV
jgi:hypothetical protein